MSSGYYISHAALWALVVFQGLVLIGLVRAVYRLQSGAAASPAISGADEMRDRVAPSFDVVDVTGARISSQDFAGQLTALLFVSPQCPTCTVTLDELEALKVKARDSVLVICRAESDECVALAEAFRLSIPVIPDPDLEISRLFRVVTVPTAILINEGGRIQSYGYPMSREELEAMITARQNAMQEVGAH